MSAPTSGSADDNSLPGFYPDPSIPGYIRYWNGAAWVPGTSRPAPGDGEAMPAPPPGVTYTQVTSAVPEETGPMFLDAEAEDTGTGSALPQLRPRGEMDRRGGPDADAEPVRSEPAPSPSPAPASVDWDDPQRLHGTRPEPASAWHADTARQGGYGGEQDRRVSWGYPEPGAQGPAATSAVPDPRRPASSPSEAEGPPQALPAAHQAPALPPAATRPARTDAGPGPAGMGAQPARGAAGGDGTMSMRAARRGGASGDSGAPDQGTMSFRTVDHDGPRAGGGGGGTGTAPGPNAPGPGDGIPVQGGAQRGWPPQAQQAPPSTQHVPHVPQQAQHVPQAHHVPPQAQPRPPQQQHQQQHRQQHRQQQQPRQQQQQPGPGAHGGASEGVIPWKPPVDNPFLQATQAEGRPASLGRRFCARLIDTIIVLGAVGAAAFPLWSKAGDHIDEKVEAAKQSGEAVTVYLLDGTTGAYLGIVFAVLLLFGVVYEALPTAKWGGTLGKKLCGLRTLDIESHDSPTFGAALRRWLVYGVLGLLVIGIVNVLWCLFDRPWRQCWHDKAARTFVAVRG